jgi:hypothetical protein
MIIKKSTIISLEVKENKYGYEYTEICFGAQVRPNVYATGDKSWLFNKVYRDEEYVKIEGVFPYDNIDLPNFGLSDDEND